MNKPAKVTQATAVPAAPTLARSWREALGLSRADLAALAGYSASQIQDFEAGRDRKSGKPIAPDAMRAYALACAMAFEIDRGAPHAPEFIAARDLYSLARQAAADAEGRLLNLLGWGNV